VITKSVSKVKGLLQTKHKQKCDVIVNMYVQCLKQITKDRYNIETCTHLY